MRYGLYCETILVFYCCIGNVFVVTTRLCSDRHELRWDMLWSCNLLSFFFIIIIKDVNHIWHSNWEVLGVRNYKGVHSKNILCFRTQNKQKKKFEFIKIVTVCNIVTLLLLFFWIEIVTLFCVRKNWSIHVSKLNFKTNYNLSTSSYAEI